MRKRKPIKAIVILTLSAILAYGGCLKKEPVKESLNTDVVANCDYKMPDTVEDLQQYLNDSFGAGLTVDGEFGNQTYQALQRFYELRECDQYARKEFKNE